MANQISILDGYLLAKKVLNLHEDVETTEDAIEEEIFDKFGVDMETFIDIATELIKLTIPLQSPIYPEIKHYCFVELLENNNVFAIAKLQVEEK